MKIKSFSILAAITLVASLAIAAQAGGTFVYPRIEGHGKVVRLPEAAEQPRPDSKICVDLTVGGDVENSNPGIEKVARFVNIYAGAGKRPASCKITVVLHGSATNVVLSDAAYAKHMSVKNNPNLSLIRELRAAGVEFVGMRASAGLEGLRAERNQRGSDRSRLGAHGQRESPGRRLRIHSAALTALNPQRDAPSPANTPTNARSQIWHRVHWRCHYARQSMELRDPDDRISGKSTSHLFAGPSFYQTSALHAIRTLLCGQPPH